MKQKVDIEFGFESWFYIAGMMGLCGGIVWALLSALWSAVEGNWAGALFGVLVGPLCGVLLFWTYAVPGYFVYKKLARRFPNGRVISATIRPLDADAQS